MADAFIGNIQEKVMQKYKTSVVDVLFYSKVCGAALLLLVCFVSGELSASIAYCWANPMSYIYLSLFGGLGCIGEMYAD